MKFRVRKNINIDFRAIGRTLFYSLLTGVFVVAYIIALPATEKIPHTVRQDLTLRDFTAQKFDILFESPVEDSDTKFLKSEMSLYKNNTEEL